MTTHRRRDVELLRTFAPVYVKERAARLIVEKYARGSRSAADVTDALAALLAQGLTDMLRQTAMAALKAVDPVPTVLWTWICQHADALGQRDLEYVLTLGLSCPRYAKRLDPTRLDTPHGLAALAHTATRLNMARQLATDFLRSLQIRIVDS